MKKNVLSVVLIIFFINLCVNAYALTNYTFSDGLVSNEITTIQMDPSGSIWIGTVEGLSRFNGLEWKTYRTANAKLPSEYINCIMPDNQGNIYFGTTAGISLFDSPRWETLRIDLPNVDVESMILESTGDIWIGTGGGLVKYRPDTKRISDTFTVNNSDISNNFINQIAIDSFEYLWLATASGVSSFDGFNAHDFVNYDTTDNLPNNFINSISVEMPLASDDIIWVATEFGVGRKVSTGAYWSKVTKVNGLLDDNVRYVIVDDQYNKWFATASGVSVLSSGGLWSSYTFETDTLVNNDCTTVAVDNSSNVWVGTNGGITKIGDNAIISFEKILNLNPDALVHVTVNDPLMNLDGAVIETLTVNVYSSTDPVGINLTLRETAVDSGIFSSNTEGEELSFSYDGSDEANRLLYVTPGDNIYASYYEADVDTFRIATAYYNEEAPFDDSLFLDPPCFIATASYDDGQPSDFTDIVKTFLKKIFK